MREKKARNALFVLAGRQYLLDLVHDTSLDLAEEACCRAYHFLLARPHQLSEKRPHHLLVLRIHAAHSRNDGSDFGKA